jgi:hypothetical protein
MAHPHYRDLIVRPEALSATEQTELNEHLQLCTDCTAFEQAWQKADTILSAATQAAPPARLSQQVVAGVFAARRRRQRRQAWLVFGLTLTGSALLVPGLLLGEVHSVADGLTMLLRQFVQLWDAVAESGLWALRLLELLPGPPLQLRLLALAVSGAGLAVAYTTLLGGMWTAALARLTLRNPSAGGGR